jgi:UDP-N-acetylmuramoyl-tripeptide--D-alanyl-D-alanine ligase
MRESHRAAVLEIGTNHPGELDPLVRMVSPQMGVITNIGREHLEFFGDLEGVAREEGRLAELLPADGRLFLNGDSEWTDGIAERSPARCVRVGLGAGNDWRAREVQADDTGVAFEVDSPRAEYSGGYRIQLLGRYQVMNALFAMAVGEQLGLNREEIARGLAECPPPGMRMQLARHEGVTVLNDAYNANADSMRAALQTLAELPCAGRRIAVLGDMAELGAHSEKSHVEAGRLTAELGIGQLFSVGKNASLMAAGARSGGLNRVMEFPDVEAAMHAIRGLVRSGDLVLLKASRVTGLERVADVLLGRGFAGRLKSN